MHFRLVCPASLPLKWDTIPENAGYEQVAGTLVELCSRGHTNQVTDTSNMSDAERKSMYIDRAIPAAGTKYRIARVFGSNKHPGEHFGGNVPALFVSPQRGEKPTDVYPNETKTEVRTMLSFLESLL
jgi:hypothetical protein